MYCTSEPCDIGQGEIVTVSATPSDTSHQSPSSRTCNEHGCKPRCDSVSHFGRLVKVNLKDWPMKRH